MQRSDIEDAAMFLQHLRTQRTQVRALPREFTPRTIDDAYAIQEAGYRFSGARSPVIKLGAATEGIQSFLGIDAPVAGRVHEEGVFTSGSVVERKFVASEPLLECEIAVRVDDAGEIDAVAPAIELVNGRLTNASSPLGLSLIADNVGGCGVILGEAIPIADAGDLDSITISLTDDEGEIASGTTSELPDGIAGTLAWAVAHESGRGRTIPGGTWIITGTCTGMTPSRFGYTYTAEYSSLGTVTFALAP